MQNAPYKSRGIGLLELMLSLLVIVIIIFTATRYFQVTNENLKVAEAENMINNIVDASYKWVQGAPDFSAMNLAVLINAGLLPYSYQYNPWKGLIGVMPQSNDPSKIRIFMQSVPPAACQNLLEKLSKYLDMKQSNCDGGNFNGYILE